MRYLDVPDLQLVQQQTDQVWRLKKPTKIMMLVLMLLPRSKKNIVKVQYLIYEDDGDAGNVADAHIAGRYKKNIVKAQEEANVYAARAACKAAAANQHQAGPQSTSLFLF